MENKEKEFEMKREKIRKLTEKWGDIRFLGKNVKERKEKVALLLESLSMPLIKE